MDMCYNGVLVMPSNYAVMDEEEMTYVEGGVTLSYSFAMRSKTNCMAIAATTRLINGYWRIGTANMAAEIYAHAFVYYNFGLALSIANAAGIGGFVKRMRDSIMNGIDLENGLDTKITLGIPRYVAYNTLYTLGPMYF